MSVFDDVKKKIFDITAKKIFGEVSKESKPNEKNLATEEDILKAIDNLDCTSTESEKEVEGEDTNITNFPAVSCWSNFEYLHKPELTGLEEIVADNRIYFTIPIGWTYDNDFTIQYWYLTFPEGCIEDDIIEFYSPIKIDDIKFPGVE